MNSFIATLGCILSFLFFVLISLALIFAIVLLIMYFISLIRDFKEDNEIFDFFEGGD